MVSPYIARIEYNLTKMNLIIWVLKLNMHVNNGKINDLLWAFGKNNKPTYRSLLEQQKYPISHNKNYWKSVIYCINEINQEKYMYINIGINQETENWNFLRKDLEK